MKKTILIICALFAVVLPALSYGAVATSTQLADIGAQIASLRAQIASLETNLPKCPFTKDLSFGQGKNDGLHSQVVLAQNWLRASGYLNISQATGWYGAMTRAAVRRWQIDNNLPVTGRVGVLERLRLCGNAESISATTTIWQVR